MIRELKFSDHTEWLDLRKKYIGGSDAGAVMGTNPFCSPFALWAEKTGKVEPFEGNVATEVGAYLERFVADMWSKKMGKSVRRKNRILVNDDYPWACANLDRLVVGEKALLECKTTTSLPVMRKLRDGEYPEQWYCQMMHYLAVTGLQRAYLAVLVGNREMLYYTLERDQEEIDILMEKEREFWNHVVNGISPELDGSESTTETLSNLFPGDSSAETIALFGADELLAQRALLMQSQKELKESIQKLDNRLKANMEDAERAVCGPWTLTWKEQSREKFDRKMFEEAHPEIPLDPYYTTTVSRVFRVTEKKNKEDKAS